MKYIVVFIVVPVVGIGLLGHIPYISFISNKWVGIYKNSTRNGNVRNFFQKDFSLPPLEEKLDGTYCSTLFYS